MDTHVAKGIFRVIGCVSPGYLKLKYVRHVDDADLRPRAKLKEGVRVISIRDDLWVDEVPIELVPPESRMPNSLIELTVRNRTEIIAVAAANNSLA